MLGRTANALYWMSRYLERAQNTARLLDAGVRMALTRDLVTAEEEWRSVMITAGQRASYEARHGSYTGVQAWNHVLRERNNPASVLAMFSLVRQNARQARNAISGELWEAINESWMEVTEELSRPVGESRIGEVLALIRRTGMLTHGAMSGSMQRDDSYHFARAGTFIERSDNVARILDIKYYLLLPSVSYVGSSLDAEQWDTVLRSVSGDRAFRWLNAAPIDARGIVGFLVLDDRFPRSLAFCHSALRGHLRPLGQSHGQEGEAHRLIRVADTRLNQLSIEAIFKEGLHQFLTGFMNANAEIGEAITRDYRFLA